MLLSFRGARLLVARAGALSASPARAVRRRAFAAPAGAAAARAPGGGAASAPVLSNTAKAKAEKERRAAKRAAARGPVFTPRAGPVFALDEALRVVRALRSPGSDGTVDVQVQLGIDARRTEQTVRGVATLPHGTGKAVRVAVFARGAAAEEARAAGAAVVGAEDLVERVAKGVVDFNRAIATPDMMPLVGRVARVLGPRGLMPNPKLGTVTAAVGDAVRAAARGQASFRSEKRGIVAAAVGKQSFSLPALRENIAAFMTALSDARPEGFKGVFLRQAVLSASHSVGVPVAVATLDPQSPTFMARDDGPPMALEPRPGAGGVAAAAAAAAVSAAGAGEGAGAGAAAAGAGGAAMR